MKWAIKRWVNIFRFSEASDGFVTLTHGSKEEADKNAIHADYGLRVGCSPTEFEWDGGDLSSAHPYGYSSVDRKCLTPEIRRAKG